MNNKKLRHTWITIASLALMILLYALWTDYLDNHFIHTLNEYGFTSPTFYQTGSWIIFIVWPIWLFPSLFFIIFFSISLFLLKHYYLDPKQNLENKHALEEGELHGKAEQNFAHALEIEKLKQQLAVLKKKYLEEHQKTETTVPAPSVAPSLPARSENITPPSSCAHHEAIISTLKAQNKKLQQQIAELQIDLEQSNKLIEKLLETQS